MLCDNGSIIRSYCCVKLFFGMLDTVRKIVIECTKDSITCYITRRAVIMRMFIFSSFPCCSANIGARTGIHRLDEIISVDRQAA